MKLTAGVGYAGSRYTPLLIMSAIPLYQLLRRIPDVTDAEARVAADSIAHVEGVATKADLHRLETELTGLIYRVVLSATVVILAGVGLMLTFIPSSP